MRHDRIPDSAASLTEDIGDVLTEIRRLIAEDEGRPVTRAGTGAEGLANRFGGNAALARSLAMRGRAAGAAARAALGGWGLPQPPQPDASLRDFDGSLLSPQDLAELLLIDVVGDDQPAGDAPAPAAPAPVFALDDDEPFAAKAHMRPDLPAPSAGRPPVAAAVTAHVAPAMAAPLDDMDDAFAAKAHMRPDLPAPSIATPLPPVARPAVAPLDDMDDVFAAKAGMRPELPTLPPVPHGAATMLNRAGAVGAATADTHPDQPAASLTRAAAAPLDDVGDAFAAKAGMRPDLPTLPPVPHAAAAAPDGADVAQAKMLPHQPAPICEGAAQAIATAAPDAAADAGAPSDASRPDAMDATPCEASPCAAEPAPAPSTDDLRDTIRALIRQELEGELGQTFATRLHQLVRREIALMMDERLT